MIRNQDMEFINGKMDGLIRGIFMKITEMVMGNFMTDIRSYTAGIGKMGSRMRENHTSKKEARVIRGPQSLETTKDTINRQVSAIEIISIKRIHDNMSTRIIDIAQKIISDSP